jgi:uncharacterized cupin superfamily protein
MRLSELKANLNMAGSLENMAYGIGPSQDFAETDMEISSIPSAWLLSGQAQTRSRVLGKTQDQLAYVMLWECGAANFKWHYGKDEFFIILSGDAFLTDNNGRERHFGPSDVAFFPAGSDATWRIPNHVRKIAILKSSFSQPLAFLLKAWIKLLELAGLSRDSGL